MAKYSLFRFL